MTTAELVKKLCKEQNITIAELARRLGQTRQNLSKKLQRDTLTIEELKAIADALGVKFEQSFTMPDGAQLKIGN
ncbi:MAG: helix-turn-helix transcriptional regulator [Eubacteriales bacterium]|nr:helix-turn-helix transcriptional regulator [Eubacteriales bacterium]